jgi:hypothetical protein
MAADPAWKPLGELLVEQELVSREDLEHALAEQFRTGRKLGEYFVEAGLVSVEQLTSVLLMQCGVDLSTDTGFGSGLRDKLAKPGAEPRREPVRFEFQTEAEPEKGRGLFRRKEKEKEKERETPSPAVPARPDKKALMTQLEALVKQFEEQQRGLVDNLASLRRTIAGIDQ